MVLFAHLQNSSRIDVDELIKDLPRMSRRKDLWLADGEKDCEDYWSDDNEINVQVRQRKDKPDLVTVKTYLDEIETPVFDRFRQSVQTLETAGLSTVSDRVAFSDYEHSLYWGRIYKFIDSCRPRMSTPRETLTQLIDPRTEEPVMSAPIENKDCQPDEDIGLEFDSVRKMSLDGLRELKEEHLAILNNLGRFIQYADISKERRGRVDPKVGLLLDDILEVSHDLLSFPGDHNSFREFLEFVTEKDGEDKESLYHTLDLIHAGVVLVRGEMGKTFPQIPQINEVLLDIAKYGPVYVATQKIKAIAESLRIKRVGLDRLLGSRYSSVSQLHSLVDIENTLTKKGEKGVAKSHSKLAHAMGPMLRYGDFKRYLKSDASEAAGYLISKMQEGGFNLDLFTSDQLSPDILSREETSLTSWERNFDGLISDLKDPRYSVFFMKYDDGEVFIRGMREKVLSLSSSQGFPYIINKVGVMLEHCKRRQKEKEDRGRKADDPLKELEERLEGLQIQMEFGGRPTGGTLYSRAWHRVPEDLSRDSFMLCCASLGGDKEDLTFKAIFNPAYVYTMHFIQGVDNPLGFSILKAGKIEGCRALLAVSPYEANPAIRTALGEANTYRYVLDSMVRTALVANAEVLLIDDIDLKVRDENGNVVRYVEGRTRTHGEEGYEQGEDVVISYRKGEPCAPRSFKKFMKKITNKYGSVRNEDVDFEQIEGDNELVESQFGNLDEAQEFHYSIQSVRPVFDPNTNYRQLTPEQTKYIFDQGYGPQNGVRTVYKISVAQYVEGRKQEGIDLRSEADTICGHARNGK